MTQIKDIAFVTPRYGHEVIGGAEYAARMMAENMVSQLGLKVQILTTTALDTNSWSNHYEPGEEVINGVRVRRFTVDQGRSPDFSSQSSRLLKYPRSATIEESRQWLNAQGPISHELLETIETSESQAILFFPYLYHPMVESITKVKEKAVLIPAAHDESPAYLPIFHPMFRAAKAIMFQSKAEEQLVDAIYHVGDKPRVRAGLGVDGHPNEISDIARRIPELGENPYLLTLGRVDQLKGATLLSELFAEYKRRNPGPLKLAFAGPITTQPIEFPDIITLGTVEEDMKWSLLKNSIGLINPSAYESFSIVLFEAWSLNRPVIVNAQCQVTSDHVVDSGGGFVFRDFAEFEAQLNLMSSNPQLRDQLGIFGNRYLNENYRWEIIVKKISHFLDRVIKV